MKKTVLTLITLAGILTNSVHASGQANESSVKYCGQNDYDNYVDCYDTQMQGWGATYTLVGIAKIKGETYRTNIMRTCVEMAKSPGDSINSMVFAGCMKKQMNIPY